MANATMPVWSELPGDHSGVEEFPPFRHTLSEKSCKFDQECLLLPNSTKIVLLLPN